MEKISGNLSQKDTDIGAYERVAYRQSECKLVAGAMCSFYKSLEKGSFES